MEHCTVSYILCLTIHSFFFFFFQAEDGIRDYKVTGVQTCALPIYADVARRVHGLLPGPELPDLIEARTRGREGAAAEVLRQVGLEPVPDLLPEGFFVLGEVEVHAVRATTSRIRHPP